MSQSQSNSQTNQGLVPPHDTGLEQAILGALMLEQNLYFDIADCVFASIFYEDRHAVIFSAIKSLADDSNPIDLYTVTNKLKEIKKLQTIGGAAYLAQLTQSVGSAAHAKYHSRILWEFWVMRTMASKLHTLIAKCYENSFDAMTEEYQTSLAYMDSLFTGSGREKHIRTILKRHAELIEERAKRAERNEIQGLSFGLTKLDSVTGGMLPGQLIILAARPAMGKTAVALKFAKSAALCDAHVTIASLEMDDLSLTDRLIGSYAGIDGNAIKSGKMSRNDWVAYEQATRELGKLNISIDDTAGTTLARLNAMTRTKHRKGELDLLVIDYLQLIESGNDKRDFKSNREREVAEITRGLKKLAKDLGIPIVLLCQLNRAAEGRSDKQPQLYDLRESGGIEQDADLVMMPFRPAYYKDLVFSDSNGNPYPDDSGIIFIRKQRNGRLADVLFKYSYDLSKITDYESTETTKDSTLFQ